MLKPDERFVTVPPSKTSTWCISIRNALGEFREPTADEIRALMQRTRETALEGALEEALGLLRSVIELAEMVGSDTTNMEAELDGTKERVRELAELLR